MVSKDYKKLPEKECFFCCNSFGQKKWKIFVPGFIQSFFVCGSCLSKFKGKGVDPRKHLIFFIKNNRFPDELKSIIGEVALPSSPIPSSNLDSTNNNFSLPSKDEKEENNDEKK